MKLLTHTSGMREKLHMLLETRHTQWPTLSCACITAREETWESRTLIVEEEGGGAVCEEGWEPCWVHRVHWRGLTHSSPSCSLPLSFSFSPSTMVLLNNLSHIIYLSTSLTHSLPHTNTLVQHTHTRNYLPIHTNAHTHMPQGVGSWGWCGVSKLESAQRETW